MYTLMKSTLAAAQVAFNENDNYQGRSFTTQQPVGDFERFGFNERASSVLVLGGPWEACEDVRYANLAAMGLNNSLSSLRRVPRDARLGVCGALPCGYTTETYSFIG